MRLSLGPWLGQRVRLGLRLGILLGLGVRLSLAVGLRLRMLLLLLLPLGRLILCQRFGLRCCCRLRWLWCRLLRLDDGFGLVGWRVNLLLAFRARRGHINAKSPLHLTIQAQPFLDLSEVWVGVESTLVTHGGLTLSAGVVVGYSRWVGELCGGANWAQFAARHGCDLRQRVGRGGRHTTVGRHRGRPACPGAA